ncbi:GyrI-like domain-containing protein [Bordetella sp. BOR01]|uniref:AraC family transcriptional regulator n=1 Tax=Bordetella sp. BOR01 TaxID=2854779 RepID=UPI001C474BEA|nr:GyrI-like domain-containing protein [Bordetella sp. BOR01]
MDPRIQYCITQIEQKILHDSTEHCAHDALIQELAQKIRLSRFHLSRLFLKDFQHSPRDYIHRNLMGRCALMVAHTRQPPFSIAIDMGFSSQQAFTRAFTRYWGISPGQFRQAHSCYIAKTNESNKLAADVRGLPASNPRITIRELPPTRFWAVRYEGMSNQKYACWNDFRKLFANLRSDMLTGPFFGLTYDTPMFVPTPFMRYYCGVQVPHGFGPKPKDAFEITLPGGRIATCEAQSTAHEVTALYGTLLDHWLPRSNYSLRASCFAERFEEFPLNWDAKSHRVQLNCWIQ